MLKNLSFSDKFTDSGLKEFALNISKLTSLNNIHLIFRYF